MGGCENGCPLLKQLIMEDTKISNEITDLKDEVYISGKEFNELLIKLSVYIREITNQSKAKGVYITDIVPPYCYDSFTISQNLNNIRASFANTMAAACFAEKEHLKMINFLNIIGLYEKYQEYYRQHDEPISMFYELKDGGWRKVDGNYICDKGNFRLPDNSNK